MKRSILVIALSLLTLALAGGLPAVAVETGTLTGQFLIKEGVPMGEGLVYLYNLATGPAPSRDKYWRVPDAVKELDKDGRLSIQLLPGEYCLGAVKRLGPQQIGPPQEGDLFLLSLDDGGKPRKYVMKAGSNLNLGVVSGAAPFTFPSGTKGLSAIAGVVQDPEGKPLEGALVFAFVTPTVVGKPLFVSDRSGKDGSFLLRVHEGGTYYLRVRDAFGGGPPPVGGVIDGRREELLVPVTVKTAETTKGIILTAKKFPGRGPVLEPGAERPRPSGPPGPMGPQGPKGPPQLPGNPAINP